MWKRPLKNLKWYDLPKHLKVVLGGANLQIKKGKMSKKNES